MFKPRAAEWYTRQVVYVAVLYEDLRSQWRITLAKIQQSLKRRLSVYIHQWVERIVFNESFDELFICEVSELRDDVWILIVNEGWFNNLLDIFHYVVFTLQNGVSNAFSLFALALKCGKNHWHILSEDLSLLFSERSLQLFVKRRVVWKLHLILNCEFLLSQLCKDNLFLLFPEINCKLFSFFETGSPVSDRGLIAPKHISN